MGTTIPLGIDFGLKRINSDFNFSDGLTLEYRVRRRKHARSLG